MKKFLSFSIAAVLALGFAACSNEDVPDPSQGSQNLGTGSYIRMSFQLATTGDSRGADNAESSGQYVLGKDLEYNVNKVYLYFFKASDGKIVKVKTSTNGAEKYYAEYGVQRTSTTSSTQEASTNANGKAAEWTTLTYELPINLIVGTEYHVYALCNKPYGDGTDETIEDESDLLDSQMTFGDATYIPTGASKEVGNIPMAARSQKGEVYETLKATKANTENNPAELDFEVERSYARIAFTNDKFNFDLYDSNDANANIIGKVTLLAYQVVNESKEFFTYRHVGTIGTDGATPDPGATTVTNGVALCYGPITEKDRYVIEPTTGEKTSSGDLFTDFNNPLGEVHTMNANTAIAGNFGNTGFTRLDASVDGVPQSVEYVAENTMAVDAQKKGQSTGIIFVAQLNPSKFINTKAGGTTTYRTGDDIYFYKGEFYSSLDAINIDSQEDLTKENMHSYGIKYFYKGIGYYEYYIRHDNNGEDTEMGIMEFAIVRNNSYELTVGKIAMSPYSALPGGPNPDDPDPNPDPDPDPDTPDPIDPDESAKVYMHVDVLVRPWVVRTNTMNLGH